MVNIDDFVKRNVIYRLESMFSDDIKNNEKLLFERINNKSILVIGGAGSIGSSFIKAILPFKPRSLVVVDINENGLAELTRDLRSIEDINIPDDYRAYPIDYSSIIFKEMFVSEGGFDIVANFSAHKHVRSEKDIFSIKALLNNNIMNAKKLLDLLVQYPPETFFSVSTDKAANPVNIMGASKRILEDVIFSYSEFFPIKTARFANVAFSNGSLPAGFIERINKKQPIAAPSDVKRYFVSMEEAGQICMLSCFLGENCDIFFPKLEEAQMMRFDVIAESLLKACGYEPIYCSSEEEALKIAKELKEDTRVYPVLFSKSDTSGEKEYEEFFTENEKVNMSRFESLGVVEEKSKIDINRLNELYKELERIIDESSSKEEVIEVLEKYLTNFKHIETGKSLDKKM